MQHDHLSWIKDGRNCITCNVYFEEYFSVAKRLIDLQAAIALRGHICPDCLTASYASCDLSHPAAKRINGKYLYCQFCWLRKSL